ncbi:MAG: PorV/PorQ family protein [Candidatus Poribacteria bacterium]|nr:PorV/PorQ family protein [Candidatus Poribacteria bacterium]
MKKRKEEKDGYVSHLTFYTACIMPDVLRFTHGLVYRLTLMFFFAMSISGGYAQNKDVGTTSNAALKLGMGARAAAMGDTFVAVADDVNTIYWNPSGLGQLERPQFSATHSEWLADIRFEWIGFAQSLGPWLAIGADAALVHTGDIPRTVESSTGSFEQDGTFSYNDLIIRVAVASRVYEGVRVGVAFQIDQQDVDFGGTKQPVPKKQVRGNSINLGVIYEPPIQNLRLGASLQNIGSDMPAFIDTPSSLPRILRIGGAYTIDIQPLLQSPKTGETPSLEKLSAQNRLVLAMDVNFPSDGSANLHAGVEYLLRNGFALRGGYRSSSDFDFLSHLSGGAGYATANYQIDYAFVPFGDVGETHRVSFTLGF